MFAPHQNQKLHKLLSRANCAYYAAARLRGPAEPPYNGKFFTAAHHEEWADLLNHHERLAIVAPRNHGKCAPRSQLILSTTGERISIADWPGGEVFAFDPQTLSLVPAYAPPSEPNGLRACLRVVTRTGRTTTVTENHPLYTSRGWVETRDLAVGDRIAVPRTLSWTEGAPVEDAWLLGALVGNGSLTASRVGLTVSDPGVVAELERVAAARDWALNLQPNGERIISMAYARGDHTPTGFARRHAIFGKNSYEKRVPPAIFTSDRASVTAFLSGLLDTDAHVNFAGGGSVEFFSVSRELMRDVQHLLSRLGVVSVLGTKRGRYRGAPHLSSRLVMRGRSILRLARALAPHGKRADELRRLAAEVEPRREGGSVDLLPEPYGMTRERALRERPDAEAERLAQAEILWDEVVDVESAGELETFALCVPGLASYVADDIINHNSFFFTFAYPLWMAEKNPGESGLIFSASQAQANEIMIRIMREVELNPNLAHLLPRSRPSSGKQNARWSTQTIELSNGSTIHARGYGTRVRGAHPLFIALDDILNDETAYSEVARQRQNDYFFSAITPMLNPGGQIVIVGTPQHQQDLLGVLKNTAGYTVREYPAIREDGSALWPERFTKAALMKICDEIKSLRFAREYLCCRPGTMVETEHGPVPIEEVRPQTRVLTHTGRWMPVVATMTSHFEGELVRVKGLLEVTPEHPVLTPDGFVCASALTPGDVITHPRPAPLGEARTTLSLIDATNIPYLLTPDRTRAYARGCHKHLESGSVGRAGAKSVPVEVETTEELMYFFGLWLAEGSFSAEDKSAVFNFGAHEADTLARTTVELVERIFGLRARLWPKPSDGNGGGGTAVVAVGNRILADWLLRLFGRGAANKAIPTWMRDLAPEALWPLVLGYFDGDGHCYDDQVRASSVSRRLTEDMRFVLARLGLFGVVRRVTPGGAKRILGRDCTLRPLFSVALFGTAADAVRTRVRPERTALWSGLKHCLQRVPYVGPVHNIEVAGDNSYVADGVAVHNCRAVVDLSSMFPLSFFRGDPSEQLQVRLGMPASYWDTLGVTNRFIGVDFALSTNQGADYTVVFVIGLDKFGNRWVIDILRERGMGFGEQKSLINSAARKYRVNMIYVESVQAQRIFGDELIRETDLPVRHFHTNTNKHSLETGLPSLRLLFENGKIRIPRGDEYSVKMTDIWIDEMRGFTFTNGRVISVTEHDDCAMAFWIADQAVRDGNFGFSFDEEPEDRAAYEEMLAQADAEADDAWNDTIAGAGPRIGHPQIVNGRVVDIDYVDEDLDNPRDRHGHAKSTQPQPPATDWRPKDGAPLARDLAAFVWR